MVGDSLNGPGRVSPGYQNIEHPFVKKIRQQVLVISRSDPIHAEAAPKQEPREFPEICLDLGAVLFLEKEPPFLRLMLDHEPVHLYDCAANQVRDPFQPDFLGMRFRAGNEIRDERSGSFKVRGVRFPVLPVEVR
jgi:hypothetical protein